MYEVKLTEVHNKYSQLTFELKTDKMLLYYSKLKTTPVSCSLTYFIAKFLQVFIRQGSRINILFGPFFIIEKISVSHILFYI